MTTPIASARKTATRETMWKRKLINGLALSRDREPEVAQGQPDAVEQRMDGRRDDADDNHHQDGGAYEQHPVHPAYPALIEPVDSLGIHQHCSEAQPGEEGGCHPLPALVEELDHRGVGPDRDDELRSRLVGEEHCNVFAGPLCDELVISDAPCF